MSVRSPEAHGVGDHHPTRLGGGRPIFLLVAGVLFGAVLRFMLATAGRVVLKFLAWAWS